MFGHHTVHTEATGVTSRHGFGINKQVGLFLLLLAVAVPVLLSTGTRNQVATHASLTHYDVAFPASLLLVQFSLGNKSDQCRSAALRSSNSLGKEGQVRGTHSLLFSDVNHSSNTNTPI